jgi:hypothetical protein
MKSMSAQLKHYMMNLNLKELNIIGTAVMNTGLFNATKVLENIEVRAREALPVENNAGDIVNLYKMLIRWNVALKYEIDIEKEPWMALLPYAPIEVNLVNFLISHKDSILLSPNDKKQLKKALSYIGHSIYFTEEPSFSDVDLVFSAVYNNSEIPQFSTKLSAMLNSLRNQHELAEFLVGLAKKSVEEVDWKYVSNFVKFNIEEINNPECIVGVLWSLSISGQSEIELLMKLYEKIDLKSLHKPNIALLYQVYLELNEVIKPPQDMQVACANVWKEILREALVYEGEKVLPDKVLTRDYFYLYPLQYYDLLDKSAYFIYNQQKLKHKSQHMIFSVMKNQLEKKGITVYEYFD